MLLFRLFPSLPPQHGNVEDVMEHAELNAEATYYTPDTPEDAACFAEDVAGINCDESQGYDEVDRKVYRNTWFYQMSVRKGWR